ncbi:MAG: hypothetical protein JST54_12580 [Deltaproteobacteria bacterium]|nr:hypothetical protein [Deltaproteobacteria bacterium]
MRKSFADNATGSADLSDTCTADVGVNECGRPVFRDSICQGHYSQRQRGQPLTELGPRRELMRPTARLQEAAVNYCSAPSEDDRAFRRLTQNLFAAALGYAESLGWKKPKAKSRAA